MTNPYSPQLDSAAVLEALEQQVACYRALAKLAVRQHEFVQNEQTESLLEVLKEREIYLDRVSSLEHTVVPAKRNWSGFTGHLPAEQRRSAEAMLVEARRLLAEITSGDEKDALALQQRKMRIGNEIRATGAAKVINRNYAASAYGRTARNLDAQS